MLKTQAQAVGSHVADGVAYALFSSNPDKLEALMDQMPVVLNDSIRDIAATFIETVGAGTPIAVYAQPLVEMAGGVSTRDYLAAGDGAIGLALTAYLQIPIQSTILRGERIQINSALLRDGDNEGSITRRGLSGRVPLPFIPSSLRPAAGLHAQHVSTTHTHTAEDGSSTTEEASASTAGTHASLGRTLDVSVGVGVGQTTETTEFEVPAEAVQSSRSESGTRHLRTQTSIHPVVMSTVRVSDRLGSASKRGATIHSTVVDRQRRQDGKPFTVRDVSGEWDTIQEGQKLDPSAVAAGGIAGSVEGAEYVMQRNLTSSKTAGITHRSAQADIGVSSKKTSYVVPGKFSDTVAPSHRSSSSGHCDHRDTLDNEPEVKRMKVKHSVNRHYDADPTADDFGSDGQFRDERGSTGVKILGKQFGEKRIAQGAQRTEGNVSFSEDRSTVSDDGNYKRMEKGQGVVLHRSTQDGVQAELLEETKFDFVSESTDVSRETAADGRTTKTSSCQRIKVGSGERKREQSAAEPTQVTEKESGHVSTVTRQQSEREGLFQDVSEEVVAERTGLERIHREGTETAGVGSDMQVTSIDYLELSQHVQSTRETRNMLFSVTTIKIEDLVMDPDSSTMVPVAGTDPVSDVRIELSVHSKAALNAIAVSAAGDVVKILVSTKEGKPSLGHVTRSLGEAGAQAMLSSVLQEKMSGMFGSNAGAIASGAVGATFALVHGNQKAAAQTAIRAAASVAADQALSALGAHDALERAFDTKDIGPFSVGRSGQSAAGQLLGSGVIASRTTGYELSTPLPGCEAVRLRVGIDHERTTRRRRNGSVVHSDARGVGVGASLPASAVSATASLMWGHEYMEPKVYRRGDYTISETWENDFVRLSFRANVGNRQLNLKLLPDFSSHSVSWKWTRRTDGMPMKTKYVPIPHAANSELEAAAKRFKPPSRRTYIEPRPSQQTTVPVEEEVIATTSTHPSLDETLSGSVAPSASATASSASHTAKLASSRRAKLREKSQRTEHVISRGEKKDVKKKIFNVKTKKKIEYHEKIQTIDPKVHEKEYIDENEGLKHKSVLRTEITRERHDISKTKTRKKAWFSRPKWSTDHTRRTLSATKVQTSNMESRVTTRTDDTDLATRVETDVGSENGVGYTETSTEHDRALLTYSTKTHLHTKDKVLETSTETMSGYRERLRVYDEEAREGIDADSQRPLQVSRNRLSQDTTSFVDERLRDGVVSSPGERRSRVDPIHEIDVTLDVESHTDGGAFHSGTLETERELEGVSGPVDYTIDRRIRRHEIEAVFEDQHDSSPQSGAGDTPEQTGRFEQRETLGGVGTFVLRGSRNEVESSATQSWGTKDSSTVARFVTEHVVGALEARLGEDTRSAPTHEALQNDPQFVAHAHDGGIDETNITLNPVQRVKHDDRVYTPGEGHTSLGRPAEDPVAASEGGGARRTFLLRQTERTETRESVSPVQAAEVRDDAPQVDDTATTAATEDLAATTPTDSLGREGEPASIELLYRESAVVRDYEPTRTAEVVSAVLVQRSERTQQDLYTMQESGLRAPEAGRGADARFNGDPSRVQRLQSRVIESTDTEPGFFLNQRRTTRTNITYTADDSGAPVELSNESQEIEPTSEMNGGSQRAVMALGGIIGDMVTDLFRLNVVQCRRCATEEAVDRIVAERGTDPCTNAAPSLNREEILKAELMRLRAQGRELAHTCGKRRNNTQCAVDIAQAYLNGMAIDLARNAPNLQYSIFAGMAAVIIPTVGMGARALAAETGCNDLSRQNLLRMLASGMEGGACAIAAALSGQGAQVSAVALGISAYGVRNLLAPDPQDKRSRMETAVDAVLGLGQGIGPFLVAPGGSALEIAAAAAGIVDCINAGRKLYRIPEGERTNADRNEFKRNVTVAIAKCGGGYLGLQAGTKIGAWVGGWFGPLGSMVGATMGGGIGAAIAQNAAAKASAYGYDAYQRECIKHTLRKEFHSFGIPFNASQNDVYARFLSLASEGEYAQMWEDEQGEEQTAEARQALLNRLCKLAARFDAALEARKGLKGGGSGTCDEGGARAGRTPRAITSNGIDEFEDTSPSEPEGSRDPEETKVEMLLEDLGTVLADAKEDKGENGEEHDDQLLEAHKDILQLLQKGGPCLRYAVLCGALRVKPNAPRETVMRLQREAYLRAHPDKGGDAHSFCRVKVLFSLLVAVRCQLKGASTKEMREFAEAENSVLYSMLLLALERNSVFKQALARLGIQVEELLRRPRAASSQCADSARPSQLRRRPGRPSSPSTTGNRRNEALG